MGRCTSTTAWTAWCSAGGCEDSLTVAGAFAWRACHCCLARVYAYLSRRLSALVFADFFSSTGCALLFARYSILTPPTILVLSRWSWSREESETSDESVSSAFVWLGCASVTQSYASACIVPVA